MSGARGRAAAPTGQRGLGVTGPAAPLICALAALVMAGAAPLGAQDPVRETSPDPAALAAARAAQARFERVRRVHMPWTVGGGGGACGEIVGRFCWRPESGDRDPPPEPADVGRARLGLLTELAGLSARSPGDGWILGQRVRYRVEGAQVAGATGAVAARAEHLEAAERLARSCDPDSHDGGWCDALLGLVLHVAGRFADAEAAFESAVRGAAWLGAVDRDMRDILDREATRLLHEAADSAAFLERLWLLADPFWLAEGNDRRSEHHARRVMVRIHEDARNAFGIPWGDDLRELHVRFGWEVAWQRTRRSSGAMATSGTAVIGHQQDDGIAFIPPGELIAGPIPAADGPWHPEQRPRREGYSPAYADSVPAAVHQLATFRRGDSLLVVAAIETPTTAAARLGGALRGEPSEGDGRGFVGLALQPWPPGPETARQVRSDRLAAPGERPAAEGAGRVVRRVVESARVPAGAYVASVEVVAAGGQAARARYGVRRDSLPAGVTDVSDLVAFTPSADATSLDRALALMLARPRVAPGQAVAVAWEVYGLDEDGEAITFDLSLRKPGEGFFGRLGRWLGFGGGDPPVRIEWVDAARPTDGAYFRAMRVEIPAEVPSGTYLLRVSAGAPGRADAHAERELIIERTGG
ncbi:MAG: hypothetical protein ABFS34_11940 [Gemmatimonadota bacterium]